MKGETLNKTSVSEYTPGPWEYGYCRKDEGVCPIPYHEVSQKDSSFWTALVNGNDNNAEANARLISAAPDMLGALNDVLTDWHSKDSNFNKKEPQYIKNVRAAIAKATNDQ